MRGIVPDLSIQDMQELVAEQKKQWGLIGSQKHIPGLILFEYDLTTGTLCQAHFKKEIHLNMDHTTGVNYRVDTKPLCLYVQAINEANAMRKIQQMLRRNSVRKQLLKPKKNGE